MRLLLCEDEHEMSAAVEAVLLRSNYSVDCVFNGEDALDYIETGLYDGVILDIMMPKKDGLQVLRDMRAEGIRYPVLMLTAKSEIDDRVGGLEAGADDYLTKPFAMKELLARVKAMTRRREEYGGKRLAFGDLSLDANTLELASENAVRLSGKEFELMQFFVRNAEKPLTESVLLEHVWNGDPEATADTVYLYVNYLRRKIAGIASRAVIEGKRGEEYILRRE